MTQYRDPLPPGVKQKVAELSLVMTYPDGYVVLVTGKGLYATATFPLAFGPGDAEVQDMTSLALPFFETRKLVIEVVLANDKPGGDPVLHVRGLFRTEGAPSDS